MLHADTNTARPPLIPQPREFTARADLSLKNGVWHLRDLGSTNGVKVNGERTHRRPLRPGDEIGIANHKYTIQYQLPPGSTIDDVFAEEEDVFGQSLMEKAGLEKPKKPGQPGSRPSGRRGN